MERIPSTIHSDPGPLLFDLRNGEVIGRPAGGAGDKGLEGSVNDHPQ